MSDRDIEQVADAAADGLPDQLASMLANRQFGRPLDHPWPLRLTTSERGVFLADADALLPVVEGYAAAQVAAERERCARIVENACASRHQPEPFTCLPCRDLARTIRAAP